MQPAAKNWRIKDLHVTLTDMQPASSEDAEHDPALTPQERPWLFNFLIAPMAVMSIGLVG
jgi:hypothetical protein